MLQQVVGELERDSLRAVRPNEGNSARNLEAVREVGHVLFF